MVGAALRGIAIPAGATDACEPVAAGSIWCLALPLIALMNASMRYGIGLLGLHPVIDLGFGANWLIGWPLSLLVGDFFYYWYHRGMHRFAWPVHAVHHSIRELNAISAFIHPLDELAHVTFATVPATLLLRIDYHAIVALPFLATLQGHFIHSCTRLNLGPLRRVINDNRFHRLHHSFLPEHRDRNFGSMTTVWDQVFGTAVFPKEGQWPETGVVDRREATGPISFLLGPLVARQTRP
jgi:sterol desaturase/sphingolipid hydroxylase (fatty acid hydroxylase superfamily)